MLDNFSTGNRANLDGLDVEVVEGELRSYERVHNAVRGVGGRLPPRRARLGAALGAGPAHLERGQHRGNAQRAARRARRRRAARRVLVELVGVRPAARAAGDRGHAARPDLAVRRREARGRALLRVVLARLRELRERRRALLQRLRPAAEPVLAVRRRDPAVRDGDRARASRSRSTATASSAATSPTSRTSSTGRSGRPRRAGASGRIFNVAASAPATRQRPSRPRSATILGKPVEKTFAPPRAGDIRDSWADVTAAREVLGWEPAVGLEDGLRRTVEALV